MGIRALISEPLWDGEGFTRSFEGQRALCRTWLISAESLFLLVGGWVNIMGWAMRRESLCACYLLGGVGLLLLVLDVVDVAVVCLELLVVDDDDDWMIG